MKTRSKVMVVLLMLFGACARTTEVPTSLEGVFRTRSAVTGLDQNPPLYLQYRFSKNGLVDVAAVEKSGRDAGRPGEKLRFTLEGRAVKVAPYEDLGPDVLFCAPDLTIVNNNRLRVDGSDYVLVRSKE